MTKEVNPSGEYKITKQPFFRLVSLLPYVHNGKLGAPLPFAMLFKNKKGDASFTHMPTWQGSPYCLWFTMEGCDCCFTNCGKHHMDGDTTTPNTVAPVKETCQAIANFLLQAEVKTLIEPTQVF